MTIRDNPELTEAELDELLGGPAGPIVLTPVDREEIEAVLAFVAKHGHQP